MVKRVINAPAETLVANRQPGPRGVPFVLPPILVFTRNGRVIGLVAAPQGANDLRLIWGIPLLGGGGYWTKNGIPIPGSEFLLPPGTNDWHFSVNGVFINPVKLVPPPEANDVEFAWARGRLTEAWWTKNGKRIEKIRFEVSSSAVYFSIH